MGLFEKKQNTCSSTVSTSSSGIPQRPSVVCRECKMMVSEQFAQKVKADFAVVLWNSGSMQFSAGTSGFVFYCPAHKLTGVDKVRIDDVHHTTEYLRFIPEKWEVVDRNGKDVKVAKKKSSKKNG